MTSDLSQNPVFYFGFGTGALQRARQARAKGARSSIEVNVETDQSDKYDQTCYVHTLAPYTYL